MNAIWHGQVIAESEQTLVAKGYRYFPRAAVRTDLLQATPKTENDLRCPHGVQFHGVVANGDRSPRAAWSYEAPRETMQSVDHRIGFWQDVELR